MTNPRLVAFALLAVAVLGCRARVVVRDPHPNPPAAVVIDPTPGTPGGAVVVVEEVDLVEAPDAPPAAIIEVRPAAPHASAVWIDGHWVYTKKGWTWSKGNWAQGNKPGLQYVPGHWDKRGRKHVWVPGHWK